MATLLKADPGIELKFCATDIATLDMPALGKLMGDSFKEIKCLYFSATYVDVEVINDLQLYLKEILEKQAVCVPNFKIPTFDYQCDFSKAGKSLSEVRTKALEHMSVMSEVVERMYMTLALEKALDGIAA